MASERNPIIGEHGNGTVPSGSYYDTGRPLFGEYSRRDRVINLVFGIITSIAVIVTLVSAFIFPSWPPHGVHVYFACCIVLLCVSHLLLIYWYRQGDLEPKFRTLIYYNSFCILLLCVCANLYMHNVN